MSSLKDFVALNEESENEIDYYQRDVVQIAKQNFSKAKKMLKKNPEFVEELNDVHNSKEGLNQFLKTKQQRDLLISAYILSRNKDEKHAQDVGLELQDPEMFNKISKRILDNTRKTAVALKNSTPSIEQVKELRDEEFSDEAIEKIKAEKEREDPEDEEEPSGEEEPDDNEGPDDEEEPGEEEHDTSFPPKEDEQETKEREEEKPKKKESPIVDKKEYPSPKKVAKDIEELKKRTIESIENTISKSKDPTKEELASAERAKEKIRKELDSYIKKAEGKEKGYSIDPTRRSAMNASVAAKKFYNDAERMASKFSTRFERSLLPGAAKRTAMKAKEGIGKVASGVKDVATDRKVKATGRALKRAGQAAAPAIKRGAKAAGEAVGRATSRVKENIAANTIGKVLGKEKRKQYADLLRANKPEEAQKIYQQAQNKSAEEKQNKRFDRLEGKKESFENIAIKNYLYELDNKNKNLSKQSDEVKIASSSLGEKGAEEYLKKMKGSIEDKEEAIEMLKTAQEELKDKQKELDQKAEQMETKEKNEAVKKALKALYS